MTALVRGSWSYIVLSSRPLRWLGRLSYGAYVFHVIAIRVVQGWVFRLGSQLPMVAAHPRPTTAAIGFSGTVALALLGFRYLESPFLNLKQRFAPA